MAACFSGLGSFEVGIPIWAGLIIVLLLGPLQALSAALRVTCWASGRDELHGKARKAQRITSGDAAFHHFCYCNERAADATERQDFSVSFFGDDARCPARMLKAWAADRIRRALSSGGKHGKIFAAGFAELRWSRFAAH